MEARKCVTVWDLLKQRVRPSEQEEMSRIIGSDIIQECYELKEELANMQEIYAEHGVKAKFGETSKNLLSLEGNQAFLHQELSMFVEDLQQKAKASGLQEDSLIPQSNIKEKKIYRYLKKNVVGQSRPQSAFNGYSTTNSKFSGFSN